MNSLILRRTQAFSLALLLSLLSCGGESLDAAPGGSEVDPWPLTLDAPGVLAYVALQGPQQALLDGIFGHAIEGLDASLPAALAVLDPESFGGSAALMLPVSDEGAFLSSLEASPFVREFSEGALTLRVPSDHPVSLLSRAAQAFGPLTQGPFGGPDLAQLASLLQSNQDHVTPLRFELREGVASFGPSFEGLLVARQLRKEITGLRRRDVEGLTFVVDVDRIRRVFYEEIKSIESTARAALQGAKSMSMMGMLADMAQRDGGGAHGRDRDGEVDSLADLIGAFDGPTIWALTEMTGFQHVLGIRLGLPDPSDFAPLVSDVSPGREPGDLAPPDAELNARLEFARESPQAAVLASLRAAPALERTLSFCADAPLFTAAAVDWVRPLAVAMLGDGTGSADWQAEMRQLLSAWDGRLAVSFVGEPIAVIGLRGDREWEPERLEAWLEPLRRAFDLEEFAELGASMDGALPELHVELIGDLVALSSARPEPAQLESVLQAFRSAEWFVGEPEAPGLRFAERLSLRPAPGGLALRLSELPWTLPAQAR